MIYRSFEELQELVFAGLRAEKHSECLNHIQAFVFNIIQNTYLNGILLDVRGLDELCLHVGKEILGKANIETQNNSAERNNVVLYIATELYHTGGHTAVIEDFVSAQPDMRNVIILTDAFNRANKNQIETRFAKSPAKLFFAPLESLPVKLVWLVNQWQKLNPERVYLFNHQHDSVTVAAAQPEMPGKLYFYHHADFQLALGTRLSHATHIDTTLNKYQHCRTCLNIENNLYFPLVANDLSVRSQNDFLQSGKLRTSSSGSFHKFASPYLYTYEDIVVEILQATDGSHVHFGYLPIEYLEVIQTKLAANHIKKENFIYIEHVHSLWRAMHEYQVDVYLSSFVVGGGKACIEIMGSGTPFIGHHNYRSSLLNEYYLIYPEAFCWKTPNDLIRYLRGITLQKLQEHSIFARTYYENNFMPTVLKEKLSGKILEEINLITNDWSYDGCNKQQLLMDINNKMLELNQKVPGGLSKLYVDTGNDYSEREVVSQWVNLTLNNFSLFFDLSKYSNIQSLRWDPMENNWCKVTIEKIYYHDKMDNKHSLDLHLLTSNGIPGKDGTIIFKTFDPMVFIHLRGDINALCINGALEIISFDEIEQSINNIYNFLSWKVLLFCYKIKGKILPPNTKRCAVVEYGSDLILNPRGFLKKINKKNFRKFLSFFLVKGVRNVRRLGSFPDNYLLYLEPSGVLPEIDVIIVTYNSGVSIQNCIKSLVSSDYLQEKIRILVLDNNSTDQTLNILEGCTSIYKNITIIKNKDNVGYGSGINLAAKYTKGKYLFILNPDTTVDRNCLKNLAMAVMLTENEGFAVWEARQQPFEHPKIYDPCTLETEWVSGACFLIDREVFEKIKKFDPCIFLYCEDVDLSWRIRMFGKKLMYVPRSIVIHDTYKNPDVIKPTQFYYSILSNGILRHKFGSIQDIIIFYIQFLGVLLYPPSLERVRWKLIRIGFSHIPRLINSLFWRIKNRKQSTDFSPTFIEWDFSIRKSGAFYKIKSTTEAPLISIIIRTKERPNFLREALQSIRNQTYRNIEVIVVEDRGEAARTVVDKFQDLKIRYFVVGKPGGRCKAGNTGLAHATGKYINFLDDDDLLYSDHVEVLVGELENTKSCLAAYTIGFEVKTQIIKEAPLIYNELDYTIVYARKHDRGNLLTSNYIPINCMMFNRELYLKEGGFDETLDILEDWDLWIRYSKHTDFLFIEKTTCLYRVPSSLSLSIKRMDVFDTAYKIVRDKHVDAFVSKKLNLF